ncbi:MAG: rod shape-determining protein MreD [Bacilli bacterium]|jgi:rod shape-determining protein MreD|nr:rod shape-determining protein MreD [Bacilli bacterium]
MIKVRLIILGLSFYLDGLLSIYQSYSLFSFLSFLPLFTITSLVLIFPYFTKQKPYLKYCFILGLFYDVAYTNTLLLNAVVFTLIGILIKCLYFYLNNNFLNGILINIITIISYETILYLILTIVQYLSFNLNTFILMLISFIITNTIYYAIIYLTLILLRRILPFKSSI